MTKHTSLKFLSGNFGSEEMVPTVDSGSKPLAPLQEGSSEFGPSGPMDISSGHLDEPPEAAILGKASSRPSLFGNSSDRSLDV